MKRFLYIVRSIRRIEMLILWVLYPVLTKLHVAIGKRIEVLIAQDEQAHKDNQ